MIFMLSAHRSVYVCLPSLSVAVAHSPASFVRSAWPFHFSTNQKNNEYMNAYIINSYHKFIAIHFMNLYNFERPERERMASRIRRGSGSSRRGDGRKKNARELEFIVHLLGSWIREANEIVAGSGGNCGDGSTQSQVRNVCARGSFVSNI